MTVKNEWSKIKKMLLDLDASLKLEAKLKVPNHQNIGPSVIESAISHHEATVLAHEKFCEEAQEKTDKDFQLFTAANEKLNKELSEARAEMSRLNKMLEYERAREFPTRGQRELEMALKSSKLVQTINLLNRHVTLHHDADCNSKEYKDINFCDCHVMAGPKALAEFAKGIPSKLGENKPVELKFLDSREFYDLMQVYRTMPAGKFVEVQESYEAVRLFIREQIEKEGA